MMSVLYLSMMLQQMPYQLSFTLQRIKVIFISVISVILNQKQKLFKMYHYRQGIVLFYKAKPDKVIKIYQGEIQEASPIDPSNYYCEVVLLLSRRGGRTVTQFFPNAAVYQLTEDNLRDSLSETIRSSYDRMVQDNLRYIQSWERGATHQRDLYLYTMAHLVLCPSTQPHFRQAILESNFPRVNWTEFELVVTHQRPDRYNANEVVVIQDAPDDDDDDDDHNQGGAVAVYNPPVVPPPPSPPMIDGGMDNYLTGNDGHDEVDVGVSSTSTQPWAPGSEKEYDLLFAQLTSTSHDEWSTQVPEGPQPSTSRMTNMGGSPFLPEMDPWNPSFSPYTAGRPSTWLDDVQTPYAPPSPLYEMQGSPHNYQSKGKAAATEQESSAESDIGVWSEDDGLDSQGESIISGSSTATREQPAHDYVLWESDEVRPGDEEASGSDTDTASEMDTSCNDSEAIVHIK